MKKIFVVSDNIITPLGFTTSRNFEAVKQKQTGIRRIENSSLSKESFYASMLSDFSPFEQLNEYSPFERICIASIESALSNTKIKLADKNTIFILSSTKGNVEIIETEELSEETRKKVSLHHTAKTISKYFESANIPLVVSNACISGALAVILAKRLLESGQYKNAVITGADVLSHFIISGFQSLHAMSTTECKPFDKYRDGINLGEGAGTLVLTTDSSLLTNSIKVEVRGGASTNDANHISGPSRTGLELSYAINSALKESEIDIRDIAFISAHGTATVFNDEMESKAFAHSGLSEVPLHSLKGNFGHTLGAAGVIESVLSIQSLKERIILPSRNFDETGTSEKINVNRKVTSSDKNHAVKTASGFGGCNAAVVYSRMN